MRQNDSEVFRMVVLGATGGTGRAVVEAALRAGHAVTAVTRRAGALPPAPGLTVAVIPGLGDLTEAVAGHDAVVSALGPAARGPVTVCADGIHSALRAMKATGPRRLVVVSAHGAAESRDRSPYSLALWASVGAKMRDKEAMEALIRASDTDWTIVRPPALRDSAPTGHYRTGTDLRIRLTTAVSRADLADFIVKETVEPAYLRRAPRIAS
ncbi:NAD(P)-dependent oxidoreductase [Herbidospora mongoliensis]|uniref:NAD(P)-dependent oxidoreductase n=1 Tax=Herbidospora mongoliensis TaxID=688067 RepID=UPI000836495B|nr:NAD(P)H-binding protein [Herbidospora mongoliensis]